jgi:hypothetical protein
MSSSSQSSGKGPVQNSSSGLDGSGSTGKCSSGHPDSQSSGKGSVQEPSSGEDPVQDSLSPKSPACDPSNHKSSSQSSFLSPAYDQETISLFEHFYRRLIEEQQQRNQRRRQIEDELVKIDALRNQLNRDAIQKHKAIIQLNEEEEKAEASRRLLVRHSSSRNSSIGEMSPTRYSSFAETSSTRVSSIGEVSESLRKPSPDRPFNFRDLDNLDSASSSAAPDSNPEDMPSPRSSLKGRKVSFQVGPDSSTESSSAIASPESLPIGSKIILPQPTMLDGQADSPSASQVGSPEPIHEGHVPGVLGLSDHTVCWILYVLTDRKELIERSLIVSVWVVSLRRGVF